jgi:hypothetical protein
MTKYLYKKDTNIIRKGVKTMMKKGKQNMLFKLITVSTVILLLSFSLPSAISSASKSTVTLTVYIQPRCYPGQTYRIEGNLKENGSGVPGSYIRVNVTAPNGTIIFSGENSTINAGIYFVYVTLDPNAPLGTYRVNATSLAYGVEASRTFQVIAIHCGDANGDGMVTVGDIVYLRSYLFRGGAPIPLECVADANGNGLVDVGDIVYLINYLFKGGPVPSGCCG